MSEDNVTESLIDRLKQLSSKPNDNVELLRTVVSRLHGRASSQDKNIRMRTLECLSNKTTGILPLLVTLLELVRDSNTTGSVAGILHDCVSPKLGKQRGVAIKQLIAINASYSVMKIVKHQQMNVEGSHYSENMLMDLLWVIAQLSQKETKFPAKARYLGFVKTFHSLLRTYHNNIRLVFPILLVIKSLSRNPSSTKVLVKEGILPTMEKTLIAIGFAPNPKLRLALNIISHLSKSKLCCIRLAKTGIIHLLLRLLERWDRYDGKLKIRILYYTLMCLQHVCSTKTGRRTMRTHNALLVLYKFSIQCPDEKIFDKLLPRVCGIINLCLDKKQLPVEYPMSPAVFNLPMSREYSIEELVRGASSSRETSPGSDSDEEDEIEEDDDEGVPKESQPEEDQGQFYGATIPIQQRDIDDLKEYSYNFREFVESVPLVTKPMRCCKSSTDQYCIKRDAQEKDNCTAKKQTSSYNEILAGGTLDQSNCQFDSKIGDRKLDNMNSSIKESKCELVNRLYRTNQSIKDLAILSNIHNHSSYQHAYRLIAARVKSVLPFIKVAYPDMLGGDGAGMLEKLNQKDRKVCRSKLLTCVDRCLHPGQLMNRVVFDLDQLTAQHQPTFTEEEEATRILTNFDELHVGQKDITKNHLLFESRFESGNLRKAIQIAQREYELILTPDVNSSKHLQWFYFEVSNMEANKPYIFNIVNCEKPNSQFNFGMKPIMYSVRESVLGRHGWVRTGSDICYFRNCYQNQTVARKVRCYLTTTFTVFFQHSNDICYFAYHYPYTYTQLMTQIWKWSTLLNDADIYFRAESLCLSLNNNETPLLTITAPDTETNRIQSRETVFLTSRVHPGESNASWVIHGTLNHLLSDLTSAYKLRQRYVFKVVPMLNMEGVINGCHRCGLTDEDLNRRWSRPNPTLHPSIYHTKGLIDFSVRVLKKVPFVYCDYHGHSRRKNVFLYGCSNEGSWSELDKQQTENPVDYLMLPHLMQQFSPSFSLSTCCFNVERMRESTARVTVWREFGIKRSYTMESSFCGCDQGPYKDHHLDTVHLKEIGASFCEAMFAVNDESSWRMIVTPETPIGNGSSSSKLYIKSKKKNPAEYDPDSDSLEQSDSDDDDIDDDFQSVLLN